MENDRWLKESNYQIKKKSERQEKKETYNYLGILETDNIKQAVMKKILK